MSKKSDNRAFMWVDPGFKKKLKKEAAEKEVTLMDLTRMKGSLVEKLDKLEKKAKKKGI